MKRKTNTKNFKAIQRKKSLISFKFRNKIEKGTKKVIMIDLLITIFFFWLMIHWIIEVIQTFNKWINGLLVWVIFLFIVEVCLFAESLKVLHKNIKLYIKNKKKSKKNTKKKNK